ncbi:GGDEF/EAL domain-containing response regulator [Coralloluteibacterium stylophorae]|uniref:EAL domain-containing protein n=1 Tax=Coralloluteibacterium stylophorae TaxID=1776034 RepID=A0A8J7VVI3_9GAMM|nr:EAL domain-containing protein [Coralloluteibacterium stylophorae]MBS7455664.1 EAL domain-containing protein [Coralloluteibacterium stylophorae]
MPQSDTVIRLLLVEDRLDDAERFISLLRNGGMAIRPLRAESSDELARLLLEHPVDLVLAAWAGTQIPFPLLMQVTDASGKDLPVIAGMESLDENAVLEALSLGARDVALRGRPEHLRAVVRRAFEGLARRRDLRRLAIALRESERRCDALIASSRDPIAYVHEGMHIRANDAYLEMFGYADFDEVEGLPLLDMVAPSHAGEFKQLLRGLSRGEPPPRSLELAAQRADGSSFDAVMEFAQATYEGESCLQIVFRQQAVDADVARELDALRQRDQVTGLYNRAHFLALLEDSVAAAAGGRGDQALLLIEPDHYSNVLADIGLAHADALLGALAERLRGALDGHSHAARFSDHGFAVLCTECDHRRSAEVAEQLRRAFDGHIVEADDRSLSLTVSIGGVQIGEKIATVQQVLSRATQSLQSAMQVGGNRAEIYDPGAVDRAEEERVLGWVERIRRALDNEGFVLHYQPIISLQGEPGEQYEVLIRLRGSEGEVVLPGAFFDIAEEHGLLDDLDRWVISHAIAACAEARTRRHSPTLFVKITQASLTRGTLQDFVASQLSKYGVDGAQLVFEIAEAKAFTALRATQEFQTAVAALGCRLALEQFGSGLNPFHLLTNLDPAFLKIDRALMQDLPRNAESQQRLRTLAEQAREHDKKVMAEFVQDAASMSVLFAAGVDYVEGHFLAAAGPLMNYDFG